MTEICLLAWAILGLIVVAILLRFSGLRMNAEEKIALDLLLVLLICVLIWMRWRRE